jgi:hypothetical protein
MTSAFLNNIENNDAIPSRVKSQAQVNLASGVPFISDADLQKALDDAHVSSKTSEAVVSEYQKSRISGLKAALAILALMTMVALLLTKRIPKTQPGSKPAA